MNSSGQNQLEAKQYNGKNKHLQMAKYFIGCYWCLYYWLLLFYLVDDYIPITSGVTFALAYQYTFRAILPTSDPKSQLYQTFFSSVKQKKLQCVEQQQQGSNYDGKRGVLYQTSGLDAVNIAIFLFYNNRNVIQF